LILFKETPFCDRIYAAPVAILRSEERRIIEVIKEL